MNSSRNSSPASLDAVQIVLYAILLLPSNYSLFRHGKLGILGWLSLVSFCAVRLVAAAIQLSEHKSKSTSPSIAGAVVENIGLSPLILTALGVLHEARHKRQSIVNSRREWIYVFLFHGAIIASLALITVGVVHLNTSASSTSTSPPRTGNLKAGFVILLGCWVNLALWNLFTFAGAPGPYQGVHGSGDGYGDNKSGNSFRQGTTLLYAVLFSLSPILIRGIYGAVSLFTSTTSDPQHPYIPSKFSSSLAANVCMSVLPQLLAGMGFAIAGVLTAREPRRNKKGLQAGAGAGADAEAIPFTSTHYVAGEREGA